MMISQSSFSDTGYCILSCRSIYPLETVAIFECPYGVSDYDKLCKINLKLGHNIQIKRKRIVLM